MSGRVAEGALPDSEEQMLRHWRKSLQTTVEGAPLLEKKPKTPLKRKRLLQESLAPM
jgi:hypothetical protein